MDRVSRYRQIVREQLGKLAEILNNQPRLGTVDIRGACVFDDDTGHYLLLALGWSARRRVKSTVLHLAIQDGKIRIEEDNTDYPIYDELVEAGVPKEDIVLAWQEPMPELDRRAAAISGA